MFSAELLENTSFPQLAANDPEDLAFEIGLWLSGLESFLDGSINIFADREDRAQGDVQEWNKKFRLTHTSLLLCSKLNYRLGKALGDIHPAKSSPENGGADDTFGIGGDLVNLVDCDELAELLRDAMILNGSLIRAEPLRFEEWKAWGNLLSDRLRATPVFDKFTAISERSGENYLPEDLQKLLGGKPVPFADQADLNMILPRFARILKSLSVVGKMLRNDEPLKPSLLIFAHVHEQTQDLITYINNRLARFPDEEADLFSSLDAASYTAALELKKVYQQELMGVAAIRPAPSIYARIETAFALLNDSFQQILAGFARLVDPDTAITDLFPNFKVKLEQSLALREQLWRVLKAVQAAEQNPEKRALQSVKKELTLFMDEPVQFLFYKDKETLERFTEEIIATGEKKDIVPILHRFGAYLETLFGQVNMRNVLTNHPFDGFAD